MTATLAPASSSLACPPRWATPRTESRPTYGGRIADVAAGLGYSCPCGCGPMLPWQRYVSDVAGEVDPATGLLAYREVVVTIPRQSGKTTEVLAVRAHRAVGFGGPQQLVFTAQTRNDARQKWEDEHWPILQNSALSSLVRIRKRTGAEAFLWANGSIDSLYAPTAKAGHGKTIDLGFIDEAFAQQDDRVEQAWRPAMITRPQPQLWIVSTAGTAESTYLRAKVDAGRERVRSGRPSSTAYFDWSAPNDADPLDPATWWACMPALGHTITEAAIRAELQTMLDEHGAAGLRLFRRAYLNQWVDDFASGWLVIPEAKWNARAGAQGRPDGVVAFAVDAAWPHAESASIGVAGYRDGELVVQVVEHRPGTSWVVDRLVELHDRHPVATFVVDRKGPAGHLVADIENAGVGLVHPKTDDVAHAAAGIYSAVAGDRPTLRHYAQKELNAALAAVEKRPLGEAWTWARKGAVDISPLTAVSLAAWAVGNAGADYDVLESVW